MACHHPICQCQCLPACLPTRDLKSTVTQAGMAYWQLLLVLVGIGFKFKFVLEHLPVRCQCCR